VRDRCAVARAREAPESREVRLRAGEARSSPEDRRCRSAPRRWPGRTRDAAHRLD